jgi:hypothetical protein
MNEDWTKNDGNVLKYIDPNQPSSDQTVVWLATCCLSMTSLLHRGKKTQRFLHLSNPLKAEFFCHRTIAERRTSTIQQNIGIAGMGIVFNTNVCRITISMYIISLTHLPQFQPCFTSPSIPLASSTS